MLISISKRIECNSGHKHIIENRKTGKTSFIIIKIFKLNQNIAINF